MDLRAELAEAAGAFLLVLLGGMALLSEGSPLVAAATFGGVVLVLVYAVGAISGAHLNPAVTLGLAAIGHFPWRRLPGYWAAQVAGAVAAAAALAALGPLGPAVAHGRLAGLAAVAVEAALTAQLAFTIAAVATDGRVPRAASGLAIGASVALGSMAGGPWTGAAMNPARALGPALLSGDLAGLAAGVAGPLLGGLLGMAAFAALRPAGRPRAVEAAA